MEDETIKSIFDLVEIIADPKIKALTYARIGLELYRIEDSRYLEAFRKSLEGAEAIEDLNELVDLLINVGVYIGGANKNSAARVFARVVELLEGASAQSRDRNLEKMIKSMLRLGILKPVLSYALLIDDSRIRNETLLSILKAYLSAGILKDAIQISKELLDEPWSSKAKSEILKFHIKREEIENALEIFNTIEGDREKLIMEIAEDLMKFPEYLSKFLDALREEELKAVSRELLSLLIESPRGEYADLVERIAEKVSDENVQVKVVAFFNRIGRREKAIEQASKIKDDYLASLAFGEIAMGYLRQGDLDKAIDAVMNVKDPKWNSRLLGEILVKILRLAIEEALEEQH